MKSRRDDDSDKPLPSFVYNSINPVTTDVARVLRLGGAISHKAGDTGSDLAADMGIGKTGQYVVNKLVRAGVDNYTGISFGDIGGVGPAGAEAYFKAGGSTMVGPSMVKASIAGLSAAGQAMLGPFGVALALADKGKSSRPKTATAYAPGWGPNGKILNLQTMYAKEVKAANAKASITPGANSHVMNMQKPGRSHETSVPPPSFQPTANKPSAYAGINT